MDKNFEKRVAAFNKVVITSEEVYKSPGHQETTGRAIDALYDLFDANGAQYPYSKAPEAILILASNAVLIAQNNIALSRRP